MSPELAACGSPVSQRAISSPPTQSALHESLALAERGVEPRIAQRDAAFDAGERDIALDGRELE